ncbi:NAD(P)H-hydrate epimerase [Vibrio xiamenensis]|uniref:Bifunctional NAD(P)H-hydrate repair enzyme n=1 Tax=Vibrio xiamenensis TaxID=861298 RepID=A0A1G8GGI9_9VIBR|nr:NAD(P)H-hydrate dehydratase [Vibrio xiamenensis]SDH93440.1 NAD(P)H-hydrate epimerase [Vibrio xiamenensis]
MSLPKLYYSSMQVKQGEVDAANASGVEMFTLMTRAGQAVFSVLTQSYPNAKRLLVCCGGGNNGGDGYVVAKLALEQQWQVTVWHVGDTEKIRGDAKRAYQAYLEAGGVVTKPSDSLANFDVVVDALLGTGLKGPVRSERLALILAINDSCLPVVAVDIPSGLNADTGAVMGCAVHASHTVSFIGLKQGLVTGKARDYVGTLHFDGLGVEKAFTQQCQAKVHAIPYELLALLRAPRSKSAHKGDFGKAVLVGGQLGMGGALMLASQACIRSGAGLTATLTHQANIQASLVACPEIMAGDWQDDALFEKRLNWASAVGIGPGLGCDEFAKKRLNQVQSMALPKVLDADALTLLSLYPNVDHNRIITPHPGEAARLLNTTVQTIEADRYRAVMSLQKRYGGVCVLKGAGTLVCSGDEVYVCTNGNPGMATGGMGDVLSGILTALLANKYSLEQAALLGVLLHSCAADEDAKINGENGLLASDLFAHIRRLINKN